MELRYNMKDSGYLEHYGVLGMKWGVRKDDTKRKSGLVEKRKAAYNKAEARIYKYGFNGPIRHRVLSVMRDRALDKYAKAVIKTNEPQKAKEREALRKKEESDADNRMRKLYKGKDPSSFFPEKELRQYASTIKKLETARAIDKAVPKGKEAVKKVLSWRHEDSAKAIAASGRVPIKTKDEIKNFKNLEKRWVKAHNNWYFSNEKTRDKYQKIYDKAKADHHKFNEEQRKKYWYN